MRKPIDLRARAETFVWKRVHSTFESAIIYNRIQRRVENSILIVRKDVYIKLMSYRTHDFEATWKQL